jgi:hypothetical protein
LNTSANLADNGFLTTVEREGLQATAVLLTFRRPLSFLQTLVANITASIIGISHLRQTTGYLVGRRRAVRELM